jgi:hypothetical protein
MSGADENHDNGVPLNNPDASQHNQRAAPKIDIEKLADKVYRLMLAEIRLEQARGQADRRRRS